MSFLKTKYGLLLLGGLLVLQIVDHLFAGSAYAEVNRNIIFGLVAGNILSLGFILLLLALIILLRPKWHHISFLIIIMAAISNLIDRAIYGGVVDYIRIGNFPIFNLADVLIVSAFAFVVFREIVPVHLKKTPTK